MKATDKFFSNKITTWKKNKVARSSYHEVCGVHDGDDEVVGKRDDPITFVSQTSAANYTTRFIPAELSIWIGWRRWISLIQLPI